MRNEQIDDMPEGVEEDCECEECAPGRLAEQREINELTKIIDQLHVENRNLRASNEELRRRVNELMFSVPAGTIKFEKDSYIALIKAIRIVFPGLGLKESKDMLDSFKNRAKTLSEANLAAKETGTPLPTDRVLQVKAIMRDHADGHLSAEDALKELRQVVRNVAG